MTKPNITAINVFIEIDGKQYIALISTEAVDIFMGLLPVVQSGQPNAATVSPLPDAVSQHLLNARIALRNHFEEFRRGTSP